MKASTKHNHTFRNEVCRTIGRDPTFDAGLATIEKISMWKNELTTEQVARTVLRNYLVRCHRIISDDYPEIANMSPEDSADFLLHLQDSGRICINLHKKGSNLIACKITELAPDTNRSASVSGT